MVNTLDTRCMKMSGVISLRDYTQEETTKLLGNLFTFFVNSSLDSFYYILHTDSDTLHIHYLVVLKRITRLKTFLNRLSDGLNLPSLAISIDKCSSINAMLRYFLHIGEDKKKYFITDIYSNMPRDYIDNLISTDDDCLDFARLVCILIDCKDEIQAMEKLGLKTFHKYRYEIKVLFDNGYALHETYERLMSDKTPF